MLGSQGLGMCGVRNCCEFFKKLVICNYKCLIVNTQRCVDLEIIVDRFVDRLRWALW